ncbi:MAG: hypothetical protein ACI857_000570 [Arenicella sp.]|jgi:hypothetical protein
MTKFNTLTLRRQLLAVFLISSSTFAQTGPGGVGSSAENKMWFDANKLGLLNGSGVSIFTDVSGNSNNLSQDNSINQPIFTSSGLNGLPVISFDGSNDYLEGGAVSGLDGNEITVFTVYQRALNTRQTIICSGYTNEIDKWIIYSNDNNNLLNSKHRSPNNIVTNHSDLGGASFMSAHYSASGVSAFKEGSLQSNNPNPYIAESGHNLTRMGAYNYNLSAYFLNGFVAELVVFNTALNDLERVLVENYLAAKYNLATASDFYAYEATHNLGVIGIGNDGTNSHSSSQGAGIVTLQSPLSMTSNEYLLVGHTNNTLSEFTTADLPATISTHKRFTRTWRAGETGDVGSTSIVFDLSTGTNNFGASTSYSLLVDSNFDIDGTFADVTPLAGIYNSGAQTVTFNVDLNDGDFFTLAGLEQELIIESTNITNNWSQTTTWDCGCIPTPNDEVYIMPGHTVNVDIDANAKYLSIDGTLNMDLDVTLNNFGDLDMTVPVIFNNGTLALIGDDVQYLDPGGQSFTFNNLTLNNSAGSDLNFFEGQYLLNGIMNPTNGALILDPAPSEFVINSTSQSTGGRIGKMESGFTASGLFTVRRFIQAGSADWRDLASPVVGAKFATWDADLSISCPDCPDGTACGEGSCFNSIKFYESSYLADVLSINDNIENGRGYEVYCADDLTSFSGTTLNTVGTLNSSASVVESVSSNWQTKGNPYACPIDFDAITFQGVGNYFYVYDETAGAYQYYDKTTGTSSTPDLANGIVAIGQGMWMKGPGTITFTQDVKETTLDAAFIRTAVPDKSIYFTLSENSSTYNCKSSLLISSIGDNGIDQFDVSHLEMENQKSPSLSFITETEYVRKNFISRDLENKVLPMHLMIKNQGYHTICASNLETFNNYIYVYLVDKQTGDVVNMKEELNYVFHANEGLNDERFTLILSNSDANDYIVQAALGIDNSQDDLTIVQISNMIDIQNTSAAGKEVSISLVNVLGQREVYSDRATINSGSNLITLPSNLSGMHILTITFESQRISKKLVL